MRRILIFSILCLALLGGCTAFDTGLTSSAQPLTATIFAMDTVMDLTIYGNEADIVDAQTRIKELETMLSVTDAASEIYAINQSGGGVLSAEAADVVGRAIDLCARVGGALDISIYPVVRAWGFTTGDYRVPSERELEELTSAVNYEKISLDRKTGQIAVSANMQIDLGSVAKGYTGDEVVSLLKEREVRSALLNLGGNVQALGCKPDGSPWKVAVRNPFGEGHVGVLEIDNQAVITSGGYERYFEEDGQVYWHVIDPTTGKPTCNGLVSVTVVGECGLVCDGLSTALFVMGMEKAVSLWEDSRDFEMILITEDGRVYVTEGLETAFALRQAAVGIDEMAVIYRGK